MNILFLISSEGYYGAENMLVTLARSLSHMGCRCVVGVFRNSRFPHTEVGEHARRQGLTVEIVECRGRWDRGVTARIRQLLINHDVDILHAHGYKADIYAYMAASDKRAALLATIHNWPNKLLTMRAYAALDRLVLRGFDRVVAVSDLVAGILRRWRIPPDKISMIFNGVDISRFRRATPTLRNKIAPGSHQLVGLVGRIVADKGGALLLRAAQKVLAIHPQTTFVLVGDGPARKEWESVATQLGIAEHVVFAGQRDDMPGVYASLDLVVLPSLVESMPMCLLEAMAAGRPIIATRVGAVPSLIVHERTGLLLAPGDVDGLAQAIGRLLADPELALRLGAEACAHAVENFSAESMARNYMWAYEQVLAGRGNRAQKPTALEVSCR